MDWPCDSASRYHNDNETGEWTFGVLLDNYSLFPNMLLSLHPDYVMYHTVRPTGPSSCQVICDWLFHPATLENPGFNPNDGIEFWDMTNRQDWHICERSQSGIKSRSYRPGPYSRREGLSAAFDQEVLRSLGHRPEW